MKIISGHNDKIISLGILTDLKEKM